MTLRVLTCALSAPFVLAAQLQLSLVTGGAERVCTGVVPLGTIETGDTLDYTLRVRNAGTAPVTLVTLSLAGTGFVMAGAPEVPATVLSGATIDLTVRLQATSGGAWTGELRINHERYVLIANAVPGLTLLCEGTPVFTNAWVDFGTAERGDSVARRFSLENRTAASLAIPSLRVQGDAFQLAATAFPAQLDPGESLGFSVIWSPQAVGSSEGLLEVNTRRFRLHGNTVEPALPAPRIVLPADALRSGQQVTISVRLANAARSSGSGQLRLEFQGKDDPAVQFLSPAGRVVSFTVSPGEDIARFGGRTEVQFQTGTTAGSLILTAQLGSSTDQVAVSLAQIPVSIDSGSAKRTASSVDVTVAAFDNARTASTIGFTFYSASGTRLSAPIQVDLTSRFSAYFQSSLLGGVFSLKAVFPVSGAVAQLDSVDVDITNALGTTRKNVKIVE